MKRGRNSSNRRRRDDSDGGFMRRKQSKYLEGMTTVDYKDHELLKKFMTERGKIMPRRTTGATAAQQRQITRAIRRARVMGLLS